MIDVDNKETTLSDGTICHNGYELIDIAKSQCDIPTISETTLKGGKHLYYVDIERYHTLPVVKHLDRDSIQQLIIYNLGFCVEAYIII